MTSSLALEAAPKDPALAMVGVEVERARSAWDESDPIDGVVFWLTRRRAAEPHRESKDMAEIKNE